LYLDCGVELIIGNNGYIWISPKQNNIENEENSKTEIEIPPVSLEIRKNMARVRNSIVVLSKMWIAIHPSTIKYVYSLSLKLNLEPKEMLLPNSIRILTENVLSEGN